MRTAIVIAGHMRTFAQTWRNQAWFLYRHLPQPIEIFVSIENDEDADSVKHLHDIMRVKRVEVEYVTQPELKASELGCPATWEAGRIYTHEPYAISVHPSAVLKQLWAIQRGYDFFKKCIEDKLQDYPLVVRVRPDLWFHDMTFPHQLPQSDEAFTPWWGRFGGLNDRLAICGWYAASQYFGTYNKLPDLLFRGAPLHPESLIYASLEAAQCRGMGTLDTTFSKAQRDGRFRFPEIIQQDIAHLARQKYGNCK